MYEPPESGRWYDFIVGEKFIKSDSSNCGDVVLLHKLMSSNFVSFSISFSGMKSALR